MKENFLLNGTIENAQSITANELYTYLESIATKSNGFIYLYSESKQATNKRAVTELFKRSMIQVNIDSTFENNVRKVERNNDLEERTINVSNYIPTTRTTAIYKNDFTLGIPYVVQTSKSRYTYDNKVFTKNELCDLNNSLMETKQNFVGASFFATKEKSESNRGEDLKNDFVWNCMKLDTLKYISINGKFFKVESSEIEKEKIEIGLKLNKIKSELKKGKVEFLEEQNELLKQLNFLLLNSVNVGTEIIENLNKHHKVEMTA